MLWCGPKIWHSCCGSPAMWGSETLSHRQVYVSPLASQRSWVLFLSLEFCHLWGSWNVTELSMGLPCWGTSVALTSNNWLSSVQLNTLKLQETVPRNRPSTMQSPQWYSHRMKGYLWMPEEHPQSCPPWHGVPRNQQDLLSVPCRPPAGCSWVFVLPTYEAMGGNHRISCVGSDL